MKLIVLLFASGVVCGLVAGYVAVRLVRRLARAAIIVGTEDGQ